MQPEDLLSKVLLYYARTKHMSPNNDRLIFKHRHQTLRTAVDHEAYVAAILKGEGRDRESVPGKGKQKRTNVPQVYISEN